MMPLSRLGCPLSLKTPNMGNPGQVVLLLFTARHVRLIWGMWVCILALGCGRVVVEFGESDSRNSYVEQQRPAPSFAAPVPSPTPRHAPIIIETRVPTPSAGKIYHAAPDVPQSRVDGAGLEVSPQGGECVLEVPDVPLSVVQDLLALAQGGAVGNNDVLSVVLSSSVRSIGPIDAGFAEYAEVALLMVRVSGGDLQEFRRYIDDCASTITGRIADFGRSHQPPASHGEILDQF